MLWKYILQRRNILVWS